MKTPKKKKTAIDKKKLIQTFGFLACAVSEEVFEGRESTSLTAIWLKDIYQQIGREEILFSEAREHARNLIELFKLLHQCDIEAKNKEAAQKLTDKK